jgi:hypothetical protein
LVAVKRHQLSDWVRLPSDVTACHGQALMPESIPQNQSVRPKTGGSRSKAVPQIVNAKVADAGGTPHTVPRIADGGLAEWAVALGIRE